MDHLHPEARIIRSEALQWWASLPPEDRIIHCEAHYGDYLKHQSLTGREIERIYAVSKD